MSQGSKVIPEQERARLRRRFERNARYLLDQTSHQPSGATQPGLLEEVNQRLLSHLEFLNPATELILDLGAGTGIGSAALHRRYPTAQIVALDWVWQVLPARGGAWPWPWRWPWPGQSRVAPPWAVCADAQCLPLAPSSVDLVWCNLTFPWCDLEQLLGEVRRVLSPEGLLIFSTLGPDTLQEWRQVVQEVDPKRATAMPEFLDMHDLGDALSAAGLGSPVLDRENLLVTYPDLRLVLEDLRWNGVSRAPPGFGGLSGRNYWQRIWYAYERLRQPAGLPLTFELVYGHAWQVRPRRTAAGKPIIPVRAFP